MNNQAKKILFISHDASRSGGPFVLLYLLQWLKKNTDYQFDVLLLDVGPLRKEFEMVANNVYLVAELLHEHPLQRRIKRKLKFNYSEENNIQKAVEKINIISYNVIYGNTIVSLKWLSIIKNKFNVKVINAIHELRVNMENFYTREYLSLNLIGMDLIIAGSQAVANDLISRYQLPTEIIKVVHAYIHTHVKPSDTKYVLPSLNIPSERFVFGGVGNVEWRKGADLLVPIGLYLKKHYPDFDFHILWIGGNASHPTLKFLNVDIEKSGLADRITIVDNTSKYLDYMNEFDVFAMLSREDPFPLVSLEASFLEKPIVMFKNTGGTEELMVNGGGMIVPYLDIEAYSKAVFDLSQNNQQRTEMGKILKKEVVEKYNSEVSCKKVLKILQEIL